MRNHYIFLIGLMALLMSFSTAFAQQTGSFEITLNFNAESRGLACYVPQDYNQDSSYRLIIALHGAQDKAANYRNALVNSLNWPDLFPHTIIICPDGGEDQSRDFYTPVGDEGIIQAAIDFATNNYSIDANDIILQGFSLGGRAALKYGLEHASDFKGLLLNTPAVQGIADALNDPALSFGINYGAANQLPIYMSYGGEDLIYVDVLNLVTEKLILNNARLYHEKVSGLGHSIAPNNKLANVAEFFETPAKQGLDLDVFRPIMESLSCGQSVASSVIVRNTGDQSITDISFTYGTDGAKTTFAWSGNLGSYDHAVINLPAHTAPGGFHSWEIEATSVNQGQQELNDQNNRTEEEVFVADSPLSAPFTEGFEGNTDAWTQEEARSVFQWYVDSDVSKDGVNSLSNYTGLFIFYNAGYEEHIRTQTLDLSSSDAPSLSFDVAFNYHQYTPPYFTDTVKFGDTLIVSISTDCGDTYTELYKKGGAELATVAEPILNPLSIQAGFFEPTPEEWRTEAINLESYKSATDAIIQFTYKSALGGNIYIDNVRFDRALDMADEPKAPAFKLYPNPSSNYVYLDFDHEAPRTIKLYNSLGVLVYAGEALGKHRLETAHLKNGIYHLEVVEGDTKASRLLTVTH